MLNCCIDRKIAREERLRQQGFSTTDSSPTDISYPEGISRNTSTADSTGKADDQDDDSDNPVASKDEECTKMTVTRISLKNESDSDDEFFECDDRTPVTEQSRVTTISASGAERSQASSSKSSGGDKPVKETADDDDDDVFEEESEKEKKEEVKEKEGDEHKPEGRLTQCGGLNLLYRDEPLYIPVTQVGRGYFDKGGTIPLGLITRNFIVCSC